MNALAPIIIISLRKYEPVELMGKFFLSIGLSLRAAGVD